MQGAAWGARRDVVERARFNLAQSIETIASIGVVNGVLDVAASFDEFRLDLRVSYDGPLPELPDKRPTNEEIIASEEGERRLAGFMLRRLADRVSASQKGGSLRDPLPLRPLNWLGAGRAAELPWLSTRRRRGIARRRPPRQRLLPGKTRCTGDRLGR